MKKLNSKQKSLACDLLVRRGEKDGITPWQVYQTGASFLVDNKLIQINFNGSAWHIKQRCVETNTLTKFSSVDTDLKDKLNRLIDDTADQARQIDPEFGKVTRKKKGKPIIGMMAFLAQQANSYDDIKKIQEAKAKHQLMMDKIYNKLFLTKASR